MRTEAASFAAVWILRVFLAVNAMYIACLAMLALRMLKIAFVG